MIAGAVVTAPEVASRDTAGWVNVFVVAPTFRKMS